MNWIANVLRRRKAKRAFREALAAKRDAARLAPYEYGADATPWWAAGE